MTDPRVSRRLFLACASAGIALPGASVGQQIEKPVEGGIGGTGIVGVLTEFGSLIVAGNHVATDSRTTYSDAYGRLQKANLRLGDSLTVEAAGSASGLVARRVHVTHPVVGPITSVSRGGRLLRINGVEVVTTSRTPFGVGARVAVSGVWRGAQVIASRISPARSATDLVSGDVLRAQGAGALRVGGVDLRGRGLGGRPFGSFATAFGRFNADSGVFETTRVTSGRFTGAAGALRRLSIEGYLAPTSTAPGYRIAGLGHSFARNLELARYANQRMLFNGAYTGKFAANTATPLPESSSARARLLGRLSRR